MHAGDVLGGDGQSLDDGWDRQLLSSDGARMAVVGDEEVAR